MENHHTILDVGCGGGRTVSKLAAIATQGKVYGIPKIQRTALSEPTALVEGLRLLTADRQIPRSKVLRTIW